MSDPIPSNLTTPKALVFDWDNTLIDTWDLIHKALADTFDSFGLAPWTLPETQARVRQSARESFPVLFGEKADEAIALYTQRYRHWSSEQLRPLGEAAMLLPHWAKAGSGPLSVVSNKQGPLLRDEAARLGWEPYFYRLIGANDAAADKPHVAPVLMALADSGIDLGPAVWFLGDTDIDMTCARNAGCTAVFIEEGAGDGKAGQKDVDCDLYLESLSGLTPVLDALGFLNS